MKNNKLEQIKRMIYLEDKISKLESKYSISFLSQGVDKEGMIDFLFDKLNLEEDVTLNIDERKYIIRACLIPLEDINNELNKYDNTHPKMDEQEFIIYLSKKYNVVLDMIFERIKDIRKIDYFNSSNQKMKVYAVPIDKSFVISKERAEEFLSFKSDPEFLDDMKKQADKIGKHITFGHSNFKKIKKR